MSEADRDALAALLFPDATTDLKACFDRYPPRDLPEGALVTRFGPSPTGFIHIGSLLTSLLDWKLAKQTNGVFILRIEDTDRTREIEGGTAMIIAALEEAGLSPTEGPQSGGQYGPYLQSERKSIYHAFARDLVRRGKAYPCFMPKEELEAITKEQEKKKILTGIYGEWARCRDLTLDQVRERLSRGERFVLRVRSTASETDRIVLNDGIRGPIELPANRIDTVLVKADGYPTYHFAHPIDDTLMRVNLIIRGDEWINTTPIHLQLFEYLGFTPPPIAHIAPVAKMEGSSKRKLSKRKDAEAAMDFYRQAGYPKLAILEYLLNLLDSGFEDWRAKNPTVPFGEFSVSIDNLGRSSALFDLAKLNNVSREIVAKMSFEEVYDAALAWAKVYDAKFSAALLADPEYAKKAINLQRDDATPRKDIAKWSDIVPHFGFLFREYFDEKAPECYSELPAIGTENISGVLEYFRDEPRLFQTNAEEWFALVKEHAAKTGYAKGAGELKRNPGQYKGTVGDFMMVARVALTGSRQSPDLRASMLAMGEAEVKRRLEKALDFVRSRPTPAS